MVDGLDFDDEPRVDQKIGPAFPDLVSPEEYVQTDLLQYPATGFTQGQGQRGLVYLLQEPGPQFVVDPMEGPDYPPRQISFDQALVAHRFPPMEPESLYPRSSASIRVRRRHPGGWAFAEEGGEAFLAFGRDAEAGDEGGVFGV